MWFVDIICGACSVIEQYDEPLNGVHGIFINIIRIILMKIPCTPAQVDDDDDDGDYDGDYDLSDDYMADDEDDEYEIYSSVHRCCWLLGASLQLRE